MIRFFLLVLSLCSSLNAVAKKQCESYKPLSGLDSNFQRVSVDSDARPSCFSDVYKLNGLLPFKVFDDINSDKILIGSNIDTGHFEVARLVGSEFVPFKLDLDARTNYLLQTAFVFQGKLYALIYDVSTSTPSGRRLSGLQEGNAIFEVELNDSSASLIRIGEPISSGIDVTPLVEVTSERAFICLQVNCIIMHQNVAQSTLSVSVKTIPKENHEILEIQEEDNKLYTLTKLTVDDRFNEVPSKEDSIFSICVMNESFKCDALPANTVPFKLIVENGRYSYSTVKTNQDIAELLEFDAARLENNKALEYGQNNLEGRMAWSSVYYLNGLSSIVGNQVLKDTDFDSIRKKLAVRLANEIIRIEELANTKYPWFYAKRYSVNREPLTSIVHLGRILRTLERGYKALNIDKDSRVVEQLANKLANFESVIEFVDKKSSEIRISKGVPFWSDGTNVPWNYQSAWINGLLSLDRGSLTKQTEDLIKVNIERLISQENLLDGVQDWAYARGNFHQGWAIEDKISFNTPEYTGNKYNTFIAHISYRSMDAIAVCSFENKLSKSDVKHFSNHMNDLANIGKLYPFIYEECTPKATKLMPFEIAFYYARSVVPHQMQNQVWALDRLSHMF